MNTLAAVFEEANRCYELAQALRAQADAAQAQARELGVEAYRAEAAYTQALIAFQSLIEQPTCEASVHEHG